MRLSKANKIINWLKTGDTELNMPVDDYDNERQLFHGIALAITLTVAVVAVFTLARPTALALRPYLRPAPEVICEHRTTAAKPEIPVGVPRTDELLPVPSRNVLL